MLVLTVKDGDQIKLADGLVTIHVRLSARRARLSFDAPPDIVVDRLQVHEARQGAPAKQRCR